MRPHNFSAMLRTGLRSGVVLIVAAAMTTVLAGTALADPVGDGVGTAVSDLAVAAVPALDPCPVTTVAQAVLATPAPAPAGAAASAGEAAGAPTGSAALPLPSLPAGLTGGAAAAPSVSQAAIAPGAGSPVAASPSAVSPSVASPSLLAPAAQSVGADRPLRALTGVATPAVAPDVDYAGVRLSTAQIRTAATVVAVGEQRGISRRGVEIALAVAMARAGLQPQVLHRSWADLTPAAVTPRAGLYSQDDRTDPADATRSFYSRLTELVPGYETDTRQDWEVGEVVQGITDGESAARWESMAVAVADALTAPAPAVAPAAPADPAAPAQAAPSDTAPSDSAPSENAASDNLACTTVDTLADGTSAATLTDAGTVFDPGTIISDEVFYDTAAMSTDGVRQFIDAQNQACTGPACLRSLRLSTPDQPADAFCRAYRGGTNEDVATVLVKFSVACGVNPQVMLTTLQKESGLLTRTDTTMASYEAAWGWHCPDTGPGGTANCDPAYAGFFNQGYGMAKQWARYKVQPEKYNYRAGQTVDILWNVVESGCGSAPVTITNTATASLYNYTPYQPNAAALASYPSTGDACSAYGNRNFFFLFRKYFGSTGGGAAGSVIARGVSVTIPNNQYVDPVLAGKAITAPSPALAAGLAAGFSTLGLPYVWGGGGSGAGPNNGCTRGGGELNSCGPEIGLDCSGLTAYVLGQAGFTIPGNSSSQRSAGQKVAWDQALPGDIVGFPGHVAIYLGTIGGVRYILEASTVGKPIHVGPMRRSDADAQVYRYWTASGAAAARTEYPFYAAAAPSPYASPTPAAARATTPPPPRRVVVPEATRPAPAALPTPAAPAQIVPSTPPAAVAPAPTPSPAAPVAPPPAPPAPVVPPPAPSSIVPTTAPTTAPPTTTPSTPAPTPSTTTPSTTATTPSPTTASTPVSTTESTPVSTSGSTSPTAGLTTPETTVIDMTATPTSAAGTPSTEASVPTGTDTGSSGTASSTSGTPSTSTAPAPTTGTPATDSGSSTPSASTAPCPDPTPTDGSTPETAPPTAPCDVPSDGVPASPAPSTVGALPAGRPAGRRTPRLSGCRAPAPARSA